jgi:hypothetical protein
MAAEAGAPTTEPQPAPTGAEEAGEPVTEEPVAEEPPVEEASEEAGETPAAG